MIPSIDDILTGYVAGTYTAAQAKALIQQHLDNAVIEAADRDGFAMAALDGFASTGLRWPDKMALARECYETADAMRAARVEVRS